MIAKIKGFKEEFEDMNNGTYDMTNNGECTQCGSCCSNILPMTEKEIRKIKSYIKIHKVKEQKHNDVLLKNITIDLTCPFLDESKTKEKCLIYQVRPKICREFNCCPSKRKELDFEHKMKCRIVNVRSEFYGKGR